MNKTELKAKLKEALKTYDLCAEIYSKYTETKLLQFQLTKFASMLPKGGKILDAGCGIGRDAKYFSEDGFDVTAIDLSKSMLDEAKKRGVNAVKMDLLSMKFEKESFDGLWCMASFSDIPKEDAEKALKNFNEILKTNGVIYFAVKEGEGQEIVAKEKYNNLPRFYAYYTQKELTELLRKNGFEIAAESTAQDDKNRWVEVFARKV